MTPLALIIQAGGGRVEGSDRALDQGRNTEQFDFLRSRGVLLHPQDGSGIRRASQILVTSAAVEETIPDVQAARRIGAAVTTRAKLLAELFNASALSVGVAGTSGKSTTVGMIGWILHRAGKSPTIMNGADMKNFVAADSPFASARIGEGGIFVSEVDESDGSIAFFAPRVAVVNNISLDHKSLDELRKPVSGFRRQGGNGGAESGQRGNRGAVARFEARSSDDLQSGCSAGRSCRLVAGPLAGRDRVCRDRAR